MADDISGNTQQLNAQAQAAEAMRESMSENLAMSERFFKASQKATGEQKKAYESISKIYDKLAKQSAELLKTQEKANDAQSELNKLLEEQKELLKDQTDAGKELAKQKQYDIDLQRQKLREAQRTGEMMQKEIAATKQAVAEMSKFKSVLGEAFETQRAKIVKNVVSVAALAKSLTDLARIARDVADISILSGSYEALKADTTFIEAGRRVGDYAWQLTQAQIQMGRLGYSGAEATAVFKQFSQLTKDTESLKMMTQSAGALAKILGVDLSESTEFMIEQNLKFNRTTEQSARTLMALQQSTESLNAGLETSIIRGRDITKVLFDISRESQAVAQEQGYISKVLQTNIVNLQKTGLSYRESFNSARTYMELMTTKSPEWMKRMAGRNIFTTLAGTDQDAKAMLDKIEKASPEIAKRVQDIMTDQKTGKMSQETASFMLNELLSQTQVGMEASLDTVVKNILGGRKTSSRGDAERVSAIFGISVAEAQNFINQTLAQVKVKDLSAALAEGSVDKIQELQKAVGVEFSPGQMEALKLASEETRNATVQSMIAMKAKTDIEKNEAAKADAKAKQIAVLEDAITKQKKLFAEAQQKGNLVELKQINDLMQNMEQQVGDLRGTKEAHENVTKTVLEKIEALLGAEGMVRGVVNALTSPAMTTALTIATTIGTFAKGAMALKDLLMGKNMAVENMVVKNVVGLGGGMGGGGLDGLTGGGKKRGGFGRGAGVRTRRAMGRRARGVLGAVTRYGGRATGAVGRVAGAAGRFGMKRLPVIGGLVGAAMAAPGIYDAYKSGDTREAVKQTSGTAGSFGGGLAGAGAGAAIGTLIFPGVGTVIGGLIGGVAGSMAGESLAEKGAEMGYDYYKRETAFGESRTPDVSAVGQSRQQSLMDLGKIPGLQPQVTQGETQMIAGSQGMFAEVFLKAQVPLAEAHAYNSTLMTRGASSY